VEIGLRDYDFRGEFVGRVSTSIDVGSCVGGQPCKF
jgi:hypothetical protein